MNRGASSFRGAGRVLPLGLFVLALLFALASCSRAGASARYHCPMHSDFVSEAPGDCPICKMSLVPIQPPSTRGAEFASPRQVAGRAEVTVSKDAMLLAHVETVTVRRDTIRRSIRAAGVVFADPYRVQHVLTRIAGWVERLNVKAVGEQVRTGQALYSLYAPDLVSTQEDFVRIFRSRDLSGGRAGAALPGAKPNSPAPAPIARKVIERYAFPEALIADLEKDGTARASIPFPAPCNGYVQTITVFEGQKIEPGAEIMTITDLSEVLVEADLFEEDIPRVREGLEAAISLPFDPSVRLTGKVIKASPFLDAASRTLKVRVRCLNKDLALKPGMFTTVALTVDSEQGVVVPDSAVLDTGIRQIAFIERAEGVFEPREVKAGLRSDGRVEILSGIEAGDRVAVRGNFLLDAESRLQAQAAREIGSDPIGETAADPARATGAASTREHWAVPPRNAGARAPAAGDAPAEGTGASPPR